MHPNISQHIDFICYNYPPYRQFLIAPVGSWNYDCADKHSDTDVKAIIVPSIEDVIYDKCESFTHLFPNEEHCDVSDIRNFMKSIQKGNPQFIEVLFSNWIYPNNEYYSAEIHALLQIREDIARCNPQNTMRAMLGMADRNYQLCKQRGKEPHANKWLYQLVRIEEQMKKYMLFMNFADCLKTDKREDLLEIKNSHWDENKILAFGERVIVECTSHYNVFKEFSHTNEDIYCQKMVEAVVKEVCRKSISKVD